jgi:hypothetical protein
VLQRQLIEQQTWLDRREKVDRLRRLRERIGKTANLDLVGQRRRLSNGAKKKKFRFSGSDYRLRFDKKQPESSKGPVRVNGCNGRLCQVVDYGK